MSLLDELSTEIGAAGEHLPLPALRLAVHDVRRANAHLVRAAQFGAAVQPSLARLGASAAHLENGAGLIMRAQDSLRAYLAAIGGHARPPGTELPPEALSGSWWSRRIAELTGESAPGCEDPARSGPDLLVRVGRAVGAGDRVGLHRQLTGAGAGLGSSLAGTATAALRRFATELLGRPPSADDLPSLRGRANVADLLPGLPSGVITALLGRVCHGTPDGHHDPTDTAVGAAVLAARFAQALGHAPERHPRADFDRTPHQPAAAQALDHGPERHARA
jgi:hypothetical protein